MTRFTDYLLEHTEGFRVIVDRRADARSGPTPERVKVEPSGTNGTPAHDLSRLAAQSPTPTAYVTRGGTVFVLATDGSGVIVYEASKGAPSALQRRAIAVLENALAVARGEQPAPIAADTEPEPTEPAPVDLDAVAVPDEPDTDQ